MTAPFTSRLPQLIIRTDFNFTKPACEPQKLWPKLCSTKGAELLLAQEIKYFLPLQVHCCDTEHDSLQPQDHEEPLGEGAVSYALPITASLQTEQSKD